MWETIFRESEQKTSSTVSLPETKNSANAFVSPFLRNFLRIKKTIPKILLAIKVERKKKRFLLPVWFISQNTNQFKSSQRKSQQRCETSWGWAGPSSAQSGVGLYFDFLQMRFHSISWIELVLLVSLNLFVSVYSVLFIKIILLGTFNFLDSVL